MQMATLLTSASLDDVLTLTHGASCFALFGAALLVLAPLQLSGAVHGLAGCHGLFDYVHASCNSGQS